MLARRADAGDVASICRVCPEGRRDTDTELYPPDGVERARGFAGRGTRPAYGRAGTALRLRRSI